MTQKLPKDGMRPIHPGEVLREEFLVPLGLSANKLAQAIGVPANRVSGIVPENRALTADTTPCRADAKSLNNKTLRILGALGVLAVLSPR